MERRGDDQITRDSQSESAAAVRCSAVAGPHRCHLTLVNHHHKKPATSNSAMMPPHIHATERRERRCISDSPRMLRSRIFESARQIWAISSINWPMKSPTKSQRAEVATNVQAQARWANGVGLSTETRSWRAAYLACLLGRFGDLMATWNYGFRSSTALPLLKSTGTETCSWTISHFPLVLR